MSISVNRVAGMPSLELTERMRERVADSVKYLPARLQLRIFSDFARISHKILDGTPFGVK
jgi:type VI protein secretion system component VasA